MTNSEEFLANYIAIERTLRRQYGSKGQYETFLQLVTKAEQRNSIIKYFADDLREYGELRNAIIHNRTPEENAVIAEPHDFVVKRLQFIRQNIEKPLKVTDIMTKPVYSAKTSFFIVKTARLMYQNVYTHVPVYNDSKFIGVLSESALLKWIGELTDKKARLDDRRLLSDMTHKLDQSGNKFNDFEFAPKNMNVLDAKNRFEAALQDGRRLGAIFITKTGKNSEKIEGILTAWDFPRLDIQ